VLRLPPFGDGQRIGLFGGSFNPAHAGHVAVATYALKRLQLDWVWWMVSPQNPLKDKSATGEYETRLEHTRELARHPRFIVTDLERQVAAKYTADTLHHLRFAMRRAHFVWIMGADSLANLHHWHHWTDIAEALPLAVLARPGYSLRALGSYAALRYDKTQLDADAAAALATSKTPAWSFISMPLKSESSSAIRRAAIAAASLGE
jgi:nicotinate-nucleotide adenylyltransferase